MFFQYEHRQGASGLARETRSHRLRSPRHHFDLFDRAFSIRGKRLLLKQAWFGGHQVLVEEKQGGGLGHGLDILTRSRWLRFAIGSGGVGEVQMTGIGDPDEYVSLAAPEGEGLATILRRQAVLLFVQRAGDAQQRDLQGSEALADEERFADALGRKGDAAFDAWSAWSGPSPLPGSTRGLSQSRAGRIPQTTIVV